MTQGTSRRREDVTWEGSERRSYSRGREVRLRTTAAYAVLELVEAVGLWYARRWAEYLTFVATALLLVPEVYELTETISVTKIVTTLINLAVLAYLLFAKRLFGLRGGGAAEAAEHHRDAAGPPSNGPSPNPHEEGAPARTPLRHRATSH